MSQLWNDVASVVLEEMLAKDSKKLVTTPGGWRARRFSAATGTLPGISVHEYGQETTLYSFGSGSSSPGQLVSPPFAGRRLSQVGEVMSRRFSTTLGGWRASSAAAASATSVVEAKNLCAQYIRARFRRSAIFHRKLGLQRLRSMMNMTAVNYGGSPSETNAHGIVFQCLNAAGKELEMRHPKLFTSVCRQVCRTLSSERATHEVFLAVAAQLFPRQEPVSWSRLVALFALTGGLAVDCVQQGHVDYVMGLIETFGAFVHERELSTWVVQQGGWTFLVDKLDPGGSHLQTCNWTTLLLFPLIVAGALYILLTVCL